MSYVNPDIHLPPKLPALAISARPSRCTSSPNCVADVAAISCMRRLVCSMLSPSCDFIDLDLRRMRTAISSGPAQFLDLLFDCLTVALGAGRRDPQIASHISTVEHGIQFEVGNQLRPSQHHCKVGRESASDKGGNPKG